MKIYGLCGFPLSHSFSKKYFTAKFLSEHLPDCRYENFELKDINELSTLIQSNPDVAGLNITIPYKKTVILLMNEIDEVAHLIGAVNTVTIIKRNNTMHLKGYNTDCVGFERSIIPLLNSHHKRALILGSGGSSIAIGYVLNKMGIQYKYVSRKKTGDGFQFDELTEEIIKDYHVIINCTPLGMYPDIESYPELPYSSLTKNHLLFDLVYNPEATVFLKKGWASGATVKNGYEMLCIQAEESWKIWNNIR